MRTRHAAWALALVLVPTMAVAGHRKEHNFTVNIDDAKDRLTCDDIEMRFWDDREDKTAIPTVRRELTLALPSAGALTLRVRAPERGGIRVQSTTDGHASALICMGAAAGTEAAANALLGELAVRNESGELIVSGPEDEEWAAYIVLSVPDDSKLDLSAGNSELSLRGVRGEFTLHTQNGPISMAGVSGVVDCEAENGPIQYRGHAGDIRLAALNGPVGVKLDAPTWTGKGLDAHTTNGPLQLSAPEGMRSGVQVECSGRSPFSWNGATTLPNWDGHHPRSFSLGDGPVLVHLSTVNGPVEIRAPKANSKKTRTI